MDARKLQRTISIAAWNWNFYKFCDKLDLRATAEDAHSVDMFDAFKQLNKAINRFDSKNLQALLDAAANE